MIEVFLSMAKRERVNCPSCHSFGHIVQFYACKDCKTQYRSMVNKLLCEEDHRHERMIDKIKKACDEV